MPSTPTQGAQADVAIARVRDLYKQTLAQTKPGWFSTETEDYNYANLQKRGAFVEQWATQLRDGAAKGVDPRNGGPYSWAPWVQTGQALESEFASYAGASITAGLWTGIVKPAVSATAETVKDAAQTAAKTAGEVLPHLHVIVAGVAVLAVLWFAAPYIKRA